MLRIILFNLLTLLVFCPPAYGQSVEDYGITEDFEDYFTEEELEDIREMLFFSLMDEDTAGASTEGREDLALEGLEETECGKETGDDATLCLSIKKLILPNVTEYCVRGRCFFYLAKTEHPSRKLMCEEQSNGCPGPK